ncbi:MAG: hypothetical protein V4558_04510 [Gemmatimonadota bacterium]
MPHLDDGMIHELLDGEVPSSELPPITAHLASCAECRGRLERAQAMMAEADELIEVLDFPTAPPAAEVTPLPVRRPLRWVTPVAWAASLVLAVALGYAARRSAPLLPLPAPESANALAGANNTAVAQQPAERSKENVLPPPPVMRSNEPAAKSAASPQATEDRNLLNGKASANVAEDARIRAEASATIPAPAPVAAAAPPVGGSASGAVREALSGIASRRSDGERQFLARDKATSKQLIDGALVDSSPFRADTIQLPDAMRLLGGRIRLIDGAVPRRLEAHGTEVRVIYSVATGELILSEQLLDGVITWRLTGPRDFNADSLAKLRKLVRE